ncbi:MAG: RNA methyltransferase [Kiritimatiellae bacterium]|nr:RNA methyltransferase [Kiritimatiellia bacterium]
MNRILFEKDEIADGVATCGGGRAAHILGVLHGEVGQTLRTGEVGGRIGAGEIVEIVRGAGGEGAKVRVKVCHGEESLRPWADVILAPPRPRVMKRLLPQLAAMGVGRIVLVGAKKVEKDFWGATLLKEENYRPLLVDGLMQCGTSILPELVCRRAFRRFVADELDAMFPTANRVVAHPYVHPSPSSCPSLSSRQSERLLLAIGPEGGWTDDEVALLEARGFARYSLGPRILRTDTAAIALLARLFSEK